MGGEGGAGTGGDGAGGDGTGGAGTGGAGTGGDGTGAAGGNGGDGGSITVDAGTFDMSANIDGTAQSAAGVLVIANNSGVGALVQQAVTVQANVNVGGP